jgi:alpha-beta hydrolase superfamily lysophospholipase
MYDFLQEKLPWATIYLWSHSLGTGISSKMARILTEQGRPAAGVVLEAPFYK